MFDLVPFRRINNDIFDLYNDMEKNFLQNFNLDFPSFKTDIVDKGDKFVLEADLPGFNKEDIDIDIDGNRLTISAKHSEKREENKDNYIRRERRFGSFVRSFDVSNIKTDEIKAEYKNGVLTLELPKINKENKSGRKINIQ
ncbi:Hsp20/alpha crystallin family protein [Caloramator sp. E03]|uniref:Hsp20/alpha crystallin family protein n=1 Tax=Caloramator sp. E03 TaxID=2576307 RepID=UPI00111028DA|nr:Hsp20/alpha crystallin family protein [Caloramator sp. E03]QCX33908.1 Hsp20/alpha crystallin family protein [Caloramator sp. E03]